MKKLISLFYIIILFSSVSLFSEESNWDLITQTDDMTDEESYYVISDWVNATSPMSFPYADVKCRLIAGFGLESTWFNFQFTTNPNLEGGEYSDNRNYKLYTTRIKFGDKLVEDVELAYDSGSVIYITNSMMFLVYLANSVDADTPYLLFEIPWYNNNPVKFKIPVSDVFDYINEAREKVATAKKLNELTELIIQANEDSKVEASAFAQEHISNLIEEIKEEKDAKEE